MSIWVGPNSYNLDCGDIFYKEGVNDTPKSIKAVFMRDSMKRDRIIWPHDSKYQFFISTKINEPFIDQNNRTIIVDARKQDVHIYVRSATRYFRHKYPYQIEIVGDKFATYNGSQSLQIINVVQDKESTKDTYDSEVIINIAANETFSRRICTVKCYQINDKTGMPTGKYDSIEIIQQADEEEPGQLTTDLYLRKGLVTWYTDYTFSKTTSQYGDENTGAKSKNGITNIYFTIGVNVPMKSGREYPHLYGTIDSEKDFIFVINDLKSGGYYPIQEGFNYQNKLKGVTNITQDGNGHWSATIYWKDNELQQEDTTDYITDVTNTSNGVFTHVGFTNALLKWTVKKGGIAKGRNTILNIGKGNIHYVYGTQTYFFDSIINGNNVTLWQQKDEIFEVNKNANCSVSIPSTISWIKLGNVFNNGDGTYQVYYNVDSVQSKVKFFIKQTGINTFPAYTNKQTYKLSAALYQQLQYFEGRKSLITISYNKVAENASVEQKEEGFGNLIKVHYPNDSFKLSLNYTSSDTASIDDSYVKFIDGIDNATFATDATTGDVYCNVTIQDNAKQNVQEQIYDVSVPDNISWEQQEKEKVTWQIVSGEINSEERIARLTWTLIPNDTSSSLGNILTTNYYQNASTDASATIYHDNVNCALTNTTDKLSTTTNKADTKTHIYTALLKVAENKTFDTTQKAYVEPTEVKDYSVGTLDNNNNSAVYVQIYGANIYKGSERNINVSITTDTNLSATRVIKQLGNPNTKDEASSAPVTTVDKSSIKVEGQAKMSSVLDITSTDLGWWQIPLVVDKNDTPIGYNTYAMVDSTSDDKDFSVELPGNTNISVPIRAWWTKTGKPISESANITIGVLKTFTATWPIVPYTGDSTQYSYAGTNWNAISDSTLWLTIPSNLRTASLTRNDTGAVRIGHINFTFNDGSTTLNPINVTINQKNTEIPETTTFNVDSTNISINSKSGIIQKQNIRVQSYNNLTNEVLPITINMLNNDDGYLQYESTLIDGYGYSISLYCSKLNESENEKEWTMTISQPYTNVVKNVTIKQPNYIFTVTTINSTALSTKDGENKLDITVKSSCDGVEEYWYLNNIPDWLTANYGQTTDNGISPISFIVNSKNNSTLQKSANIEFVQPSSGLKRIITVTQDGFKELDNFATIELYGHDKVERILWSNQNDKYLQPTIVHSTNNTIDPNKDATLTIIEKEGDLNGNCLLTVTAPTWNNSMNYKFDEITLQNNKYIIGTLPVVFHASIFDVDSEEENDTVWYVDKEMNKVLNIYTVHTYIDGVIEEFEIIGINGKFNATISGNSVIVIATEDNNTSTYLEGSLQLRQKKSNRIILIKLKQQY